MRPVVIVIHLPAIHNTSRLSQAEEQLAVKALVPKLAVEALDVAVLPRAALLDEQCPDLLTRQPLLDRLRGEFRPVIATNESRPTANGE